MNLIYFQTELQFAATTAIFNGDLEHYRATLHQMCKAQYGSKAWNIWEHECIKPIKMWGKLKSSMYFLVLSFSTLNQKICNSS